MKNTTPRIKAIDIARRNLSQIYTPLKIVVDDRNTNKGNFIEFHKNPKIFQFLSILQLKERQ